MLACMGKNEQKTDYAIRHVMVRLPEPDAVVLESEAKSKGTNLAAYCRELLLNHLLQKDKTDNFRPVVREVLRDILTSEELDGEFSEKVAKALAKKYL